MESRRGAHGALRLAIETRRSPSVVIQRECKRDRCGPASGVRPRHLAYPVGDRTAAGPREFRIADDLGFSTAVTTRPGVIFPRHANHLMALPRISLNGNFQKPRYAKVLISGAATALNNRFRQVNVA